MAAPTDLSAYDVPTVDTVDMTEKPTVGGMSFGGVGSALQLEAQVQRCERSKTDQKCNVLRKISRECLLSIEPLPQFPFPDSGKGGLSKEILNTFHPGAASNNPAKVPDPLYRGWGEQFYSAWPSSKTSTVWTTTCGMHCFTQVVRYLRKKGETKSVYDLMLDDLKTTDADKIKVNQDAAPVFTNAALRADASLKDLFDAAKLQKTHAVWDPTRADYYQFWYPIWVLWWIRATEGKTITSWTKADNPLINGSGVFLWQRFSEYGKTLAKAAGGHAKSLNVPSTLTRFDLCMVESRRQGRTKDAIREIVAALDDGYPVVMLRPGHFVLCVGYVEDDAGLRLIINDSGRNAIQYFIDPFIPHNIEEPTSPKKNTADAVGKTVLTAEDGTQTTDGDGEATARRALQKQGYHVTDFTGTTKVYQDKIVPKGSKKATTTREKTCYYFTWDWRFRSFWWNEQYILRFATGDVDKQTLAVKLADTKSPPPPAAASAPTPAPTPAPVQKPAPTAPVPMPSRA